MYKQLGHHHDGPVARGAFGCVVCVHVLKWISQLGPWDELVALGEEFRGAFAAEVDCSVVEKSELIVFTFHE